MGNAFTLHGVIFGLTLAMGRLLYVNIAAEVCWLLGRLSGFEGVENWERMVSLFGDMQWWLAPYLILRCRHCLGSRFLCIVESVNGFSPSVVCREMRINKVGWVGVRGQYLLLCLLVA